MDIHSYVGIKDRIKLQLEAAIGEFELMPITIGSGESAALDQIRVNLDKLSNEPIIYSNDDYPIIYEIFRHNRS